MGCFHNCVFRLTNRHLIILFLFLLISSLTHVVFMAEGRDIFKLTEAAQMGREENVVMVRSLIGSRPPRCERRCSSCGHCEAVQVPIAPQFKNQERRSHHFYATPSVAYSRGDGISNYKPMCWKCKCGDFIFNP